MRCDTFGVTPSEKWLLINVIEGGKKITFHYHKACFTVLPTMSHWLKKQNTDNICYNLGFNIYVCVLLDVTLSTEITPQKQTLNIIFVK